MTALTKAALAVERLFRPRHRMDPALADHVLVLMFPSTLGCMVLETPIFEALRRGRPGRKIAVATYGLGMQVMRFSPLIDELIQTPHPAGDLLGAVRTLRRELRMRGFRPDCVLTAAFDRQRAITRLAILAGGRAWRGGFAEEPWMYDASLAFDESLSVLDNNLRVPALLACDGQGIEPRIFYAQHDLEAAHGAFAAARGRGRFVLSVVSMRSSGPIWPSDRFSEVIRHASEELGCDVFFTGTPREASAIEALRAHAGTGELLLEIESVARLMALFALSDLVLAVDTGPMHVARAAGVPMVVLSGSWDRPNQWLPLGRPQIRILKSPYRLNSGKDDLMLEIQVHDVKKALEELVARYPPDAEVRAARAAASLSGIDPDVR